MNLQRFLKSYLRQFPHSSRAEIAQDLRRRAVGEDLVSEVNPMLYRGKQRGLFQSSGTNPPRWRLPGTSERAAERALLKRQRSRAAAPKFDSSKRVPVPRVRYTSAVARTDIDIRIDKPYRWQREALAAWRKRGRLGVIEAVTGTGKTNVGLTAAGDELRRGGKVLILVPTIELKDQWRRKIAACLPGASVSERGGGKKGTLQEADLLISVVNSIRDGKIGLPGGRGLLIADECHRYGSKFNRLALSPHFPHRLGLTATLTREDHGHIEWLLPYFWQEIFRLDYRHAKREGIIAPFRIALIGVCLRPAERERYDKVSEEISKHRSTLVRQYGVPEEPFDEFMRHVVALTQEYPSQQAKVAARFMKCMSDRQRLLAETPVKRDALANLAPSLRTANRVIVFTQTKQGARSAKHVLASHGLRVGVVDSGVQQRARRAVLDSFRDGNHQVIVAPRVLDEGIDVPEADVGVIATASRSKRQMIQRMGRIIRKKVGGKHARFVVLFVEGTCEDPADGAHEAFLEELVDVAEEQRTFDLPKDQTAITRFLHEGARRR